MKVWNRDPTKFSPDRDIFAFDARRAARIVWVVITISLIATMLRLEPNIKTWQIQVIAIISAVTAISLILEYFTQSIIAFFPTMAAHLILPVVFASESTYPWVSYGLLIVVSVVFVVIMENTAFAISSIFALVTILYYVSSLHLKSISDNVDNTLLKGYFSTSWCLIVGLGALFIKISYLKYSGAIEATISQIYQIQITEKHKLSQLNLRDFENSQLHGTILNTLIAIRNAPDLMKNRLLVSEYLRKDLTTLKLEVTAPALTAEDLCKENSTLSTQREVRIKFEIEELPLLPEDLQNLVREISRELILNTKKHTLASKCSIKIFTVEYISDELVDKEILARALIIEATDDSPEFSDLSGNELLRNSKRSDSLTRLIRNIEGSMEVSSYENQITRRVVLPLPSEPRYYVNRISKLRTEAIRYVGLGYIRLSFLFGVIAFPGYLYLGISRNVVLLLIVHFIFTGTALVVKRYSSWFAAIGAILAISIFPILSVGDLVCEDIQYLPWLFNSIIGSIFLSSMLINHRFFRWLPTLIFYISCTQIAERLPTACKQLLDGSTPGILLISLVALGISYARKRDLTYEERFITSAQKEFDRIEELREKVIDERRALISKVESFASAIETDSDLTGSINSLILEIRAFLLLSEYLDNPLIQYLHVAIKDRFDKGLLTHLEINCTDFPHFSDSADAIDAVNEIILWARDREVRISISKYEDLVVHATLEANQASEITEAGHDKNDLTFHFSF